MSVSTYIIQFEESYFISVIDGGRDSRGRLAQTYITLRELVRALSPSRAWSPTIFYIFTRAANGSSVLTITEKASTRSY